MINFELETFINQYLSVRKIKDYAPNGLQIEGKQNIQRIVTGVTASQALIDKAIELNADLVLVHHGYFWKSEDPRIIHYKYDRISKLIKHDINLMGYHLPLDVHDEIGNNILLGKGMGVENITPLDPTESFPLILKGAFSRDYTPLELNRMIADLLGREPLIFGMNSKQKIRTIAWCSGAAQDYISQASMAGVDAYLTGEVSERTFHEANEMGLYCIAAGHHATERSGIKALGDLLAHQFQLDVKFIDCYNPI